MSEEEKAARFLEADNLFDFATRLCKLQSDGGSYFCFEHPHRAGSWQRDCVKAIGGLDGTFAVSFDQCQAGLVAPGENPRPIKKRTTLMSNAQAINTIFKPLQRVCPPDTRQVIEGSIDGFSLSKWCQHYPPASQTVAMPLPSRQQSGSRPHLIRSPMLKTKV